MVTLYQFLGSCDLKLVWKDMSKVPIPHFIEFYVSHVGPVYFRNSFSVHLDFALKIISWLPSNIIELHLCCNFINLIHELHLSLSLQLHGSPETATIFLAREVVDYSLVLKLNSSLSYNTQFTNYLYFSALDY